MKKFILIVLVLAISLIIPSVLAYPPGGYDVMQGDADITIALQPTGTDQILADGPATVKRAEPREQGGKMVIETEMVLLELRGTSSNYGPIRITVSSVHERRTIGKISQSLPSQDYPADSFFDIYFEISIPNLQETFINIMPMRISSLINKIPPLGEKEHTNEQIIPLVPKSNPLAPPWGLIEPMHFKLKFLQKPSLSVRPAGPSSLPPERILGIPPAPPGINPGLAPSDNLDALSYGRDIIRHPMNLIFSVDSSSLGAPGSGVNTEALLGEAHGDEFISFNLPPGTGQNLLLLDELKLGLQVCDDIDALDNHPPKFVDADSDNIPDQGKPVYFSLQTGSPTLSGPMTADDIIMYLSGTLSVFADGITNIGLIPGDDIDALILFDKGLNHTLNPGTTMMPPVLFQSDLALFSLAPGSPTLSGSNLKLPLGGSPADIFITAFDGNFLLFTNFASLGLLPTDNVDALKCLGDRLRFYIKGTAAGGGNVTLTLFGNAVNVSTIQGQDDQLITANLVAAINNNATFNSWGVAATLFYGSGIVEVGEGTAEESQIQCTDSGLEMGYGDPPPTRVMDWSLY